MYTPVCSREREQKEILSDTQGPDFRLYRSSAVFLFLIVRYQHAFISARSAERVSRGEWGAEE